MYIEYVLCVYTLVLILVSIGYRLVDACIFIMYSNMYILYYAFLIEVIVEVVTIRHCMYILQAVNVYLCMCM